ncbi:hypothetical protein GCM10010124_11250 [Pilimelia terevasa]|uniref:PSP1 C-terminal domain-containing protein n=1 Tax=Pilimelia terevasa TaxID=53372 RepID=A0A8J3BGJ9_9ACTN|nr:regulatory iron-sulfur-containing complex subunit RicT [Pilimelia terevasa]GGK20395.1 hypothetical protein GCM10010124_11250 [Pilimelia terevasa]
MGMLCAVSFHRYGRLYYFDPGPLSPRVGDAVLVPTDEGPEVAECVWAAQWVSEDTSGFPRLAGLADAGALDRDARLRRRRADAKVAAKKLIRAHDLPMRVLAVDCLDPSGTEPERVTLYFTAPHRVDFRSLVRDLGATLHCRVSLRQLSARDSARVQGGIGSCGRDLCCATFLTDFEPVTVRMARDQDLPLNPMRISGACGRLMCCLKYEHPLYAGSSTYPSTGQQVDTPEGEGRVVARHPPSETVVVRRSSDGGLRRCALSEVCGSRQAYEERPLS